MLIFRYPYAYVELGPVLSCVILFSTSFLSYVCATYMVEIVAVAGADDTKASLFAHDQYKDEKMA